jgi:hypothetical protein
MCDLRNGKRTVIGTWKVRSLYTAGSLTTTVRELARYKLDLVGVQGVRLDKGGMARAGGFYFFLWKRKLKSSIVNIFYTAEYYQQIGE